MKDFNPVNFPDDPKQWPELLVVAGTIFGEARGEDLLTKIAVAIVIRNRVESSTKWWGQTYKTVCLKRWQFSCWLISDVNRAKIFQPLAYASPEIWLDCLTAARIVMAKPQIISDTLGGADHYFDRSIDTPEKRPRWAKQLTFIDSVGNLRLYGRA